jgi:hypothetical protein
VKASVEDNQIVMKGVGGKKVVNKPNKKKRLKKIANTSNNICECIMM